MLALTLARHALIEYAAQRHPYGPLLEIADHLSMAIDALPGSAVALKHANRLCEQFEGDFRCAEALKMVCERLPKQAAKEPDPDVSR